MIPALTGYIDRAKRKSIVAETRQAVMAAQTISDEDMQKIRQLMQQQRLSFQKQKLQRQLNYQKLKEQLKE